MFTLTETDTSLEINSLMQPGSRVVIALIGLIPLLAPYELLIKTRWQSFFNLFFLVVAVICLGALAVSAACFFAALAGLSTRMVFDRQQRALTITRWAPLVPPHPLVYSLANIASIEVEKHDWSDSAPDYSLVIVLAGGERYPAGRENSQAEMEQVRRRVEIFLGWADGRAGASRSGSMEAA